MDGTAKTITLANAVGDIDGAVHIYVDGTEVVFTRLDGTTPTTSNAMPVGKSGACQVFSMPAGKLTVKLIGAAGSTAYVTPGRGV
jgi:hypothetical protein